MKRAAAVLLLLVCNSWAQTDKSGYNLFNPTPDDQLRELSPDRPDKTESPYTVDAGHWQLEMDFANFTSDGATHTWNVAPVNLKVGILNNVDVQFVFDDYVNIHTPHRTHSGLGDFTLRLKVNVWGDDGGQTAFALLPFMTLPTNSGGVGNDAVEGGIILPLAVKLPGDWDVGMETAVSGDQNSGSSRYHTEVENSITFGHAIAGKLSGYIEFYSSVSTENGAGWVGTVDFGVEYAATENVQFDTGCNLGVTGAADDVNVFSGVTARF